MKRLRIIIFMALVQSVGLAQQVKVGETVPNYIFKKTINSDSNEISIQHLRGKVVILEFWATWCSPCIPEMKKLESLQKKFDGAIEIVAVSNENIDRLQKYVSATNSRLKIASDTSHRVVFPYKVIPHAIIIDRDGIVRAITNPKNIDQKAIEMLLSDNIIDVATKDDFLVEELESPSDTIKVISNSEYSLFLSGYDPNKRPGISTNKNVNGEINGIAFSNSSILRLYMSLFDITLNRIVFKDGLTIDDFPYEKKNLYNFSVEVSDKYEQNWKDLSVDFLNSNLKYRIKESTDSLICYEIKDIGKILKNSPESANTAFSYGGGMFKSEKTELKYLVNYLEEFTDVPVIDKTNLKGFFDINLEWQLEDPKTLNSELKKYGLVLERSTTKVPVEVIQVYKK